MALYALSSWPKKRAEYGVSMECETAVKYINSQFWFMPGWSFHAEDWDRFQSAINVTVTYPAARSEHECWPDYPEMVPNGASATRSILVDDCGSVDELEVRVFLGVCLPALIHEAREFFRTGPDGNAPFHPHRSEGMRKWEDIVDELSEQKVRDLLGGVREDLAFGKV